jgi:hypothetical protein
MPLIYDNTLPISGLLENLYEYINNVSGYSPQDGVIDNANGLINTDGGVSTRFIIETYNSTNTFGSSLRGKRARGTINSPSGILAEDVLLQVVGDGYHGSGFQNATVSMVFKAAENWESGKNGTYIIWRTAPTGTSTQLERLRLTDQGDFGIKHDKPIYTLDVSGSGNFTNCIYENGNKLSTVIYVNATSGSLNEKILGYLTQSQANLLYLTTGASGEFYKITNPAGYITNNSLIGLSNSGDITSTGTSLQNQIFLITTETGTFYKKSNPNNFAHSGYSQGISGSLNEKIELTGTLIINSFGNYYLNSNPNQYIKSGEVINTYVLKTDTGNFISTNQTGQFYPASNPQNYITNTSLNGLTTTGYVNTVSGSLNEKIQAGGLTEPQANLLYLQTGASGNFYSSSNPNNFIKSGEIVNIYVLKTDTGNFISNNQTGQFYPASNPNSYITSSNLIGLANTGYVQNISGSINERFENTGISIQSQLNTKYSTSNPNQYINSGDVSITYATITNLASTGSNLQSQINNIYTETGTFYKKSNPNNFSHSGNVEASGTALQNQLSNYYLKTNPANYTKSGESLTGISISGGIAIQNVLNINAGSNITLTQQGLNTLSIASAGGGGNLNGLCTSGDLTSTGSYLQGQINSINAGTGNFLSTNTANLLYLTTGVSGEFYKTSNPANYITNTNLIGLISTGSANLTYLVTGASGSFYPNSNPNNYITNSNLVGLISSGSANLTYLTTGASGAFYSSSNPSNFITTNNLNGLISTGSADLRYLASGASGEFYKASNPSNYITNTNLVGLISTGSANLTYLTTGASGAFYASSNPNNYITNSNLLGFGTTGSYDLRYLNSGCSGEFYKSTNPAGYISSSSLNGLISTGSADIRYLSSGASGDFYRSNNPSNYINSSNLIGLANSGNFVSGISVTGGIGIRGAVNINAGANISISQTDSNSLTISSTAGGGQTYPGVTGITMTGSLSISGAINFAGQNINIIHSGNTILFSGNTPAAPGAGEANTASNLGDGSGLFAQKAGVDLQFKSIKPLDGIRISGDANTITIGPTQQYFQFSVGAVTYTNMAAGQTFFGNSSAYITQIDLSPFTGCQLVVNKAGTAGAAGAFLFLGYRNAFTTTVASYAPLVDVHPKTMINVANTMITSGWYPITNSAKTVTNIALLASGGDGVLDPAFGMITAYFK